MATSWPTSVVGSTLGTGSVRDAVAGTATRPAEIRAGLAIAARRSWSSWASSCFRAPATSFWLTSGVSDREPPAVGAGFTTRMTTEL